MIKLNNSDFCDVIAEPNVSNLKDLKIRPGKVSYDATKHKIRFQKRSETLKRWATEEPSLILQWQFKRNQHALSLLIFRYQEMINGLIRTKINNCSSINLDVDDLKQVAKQAMIIAISDFSFDKGVKLATFARVIISNSLSRYVLDFANPFRIGTSPNERKAINISRTLWSKKKNNSLNRPAYNDDDIQTVMRIADVNQNLAKDAVYCMHLNRIDVSKAFWPQGEFDIADKSSASALETNLFAKQLNDIICGFIATLEPRRAKILTLLLNQEEFDPSVLAKEMGITRTRVYQLTKSAKQLLKQKLINTGISPRDFSI